MQRERDRKTDRQIDRGALGWASKWMEGLIYNLEIPGPQLGTQLLPFPCYDAGITAECLPS